MADYQDDFKRILDEEVSNYIARALGLLSGGWAGGGGHKHKSSYTLASVAAFASAGSSWLEAALGLP
jgi:hypothetical protein